MEVCLNQNKQKHTITVSGKLIKDYVSSNEQTLTQYSYINCVSVVVVESVDCSGETTLLPNKDGSTCDPYNIVVHGIFDEDKDTYIYIPDDTDYFFEKDGWYRFTHLVIPTKKYFVDLGFNGKINLDELKDHLTELFGSCEIPERIVVFDTEKYCFLLGELFKYQILNTEGETPYYTYEIHYDWKQITLDDVLCIQRSNFSNTIECCSMDIVNYSYLEEKYMNKVAELLKNYQNGVCSQNCEDFSKNNQAEIQLRDYYWMALNAVKYANELENYCKALSLLECVSQCNSNNSDDSNYCFQVNYGNGCGCS